VSRDSQRPGAPGDPDVAPKRPNTRERRNQRRCLPMLHPHAKEHMWQRMSMASALKKALIMGSGRGQRAHLLEINVDETEGDARLQTGY